MASSMLYSMPNPTMNSATFTADPMPQPCSFRQGHFPVLKSSNPILHCNTSTSLHLSNNSANSRTRIISSTKSNMASKLASVWREIQGLNNWENMVEPLHPLLRDEIIRYGEFVVACYKAFDLDPNSKRYLNCKYGKRTMLREVGMGDSGYEVTKYIYATPPDINIPIQTGTGPKWIGYIATSAGRQVNVLGRRDIVITFRGTVTSPEWIANLMSSLTPARLDPHDRRPDLKVEEGFLSLYTESGPHNFGPGSCREQLLSEVSRLIREHTDEEISITVAGHSMGSSLALLLAYDIAELGLNRRLCGKEIPVTVFSFGGPRVGNSGFKERCEELGVKVLRVVNVNDPITKLPGFFFNENFRGPRGSCSCYAHVGVELLLDFFKMHNPSCVHDLGNYIGLLKCPKSLHRVDRRPGKNLLEKAKGFLSLSAQKSLEALQWRDAATKMFNLVQSQWT